MKHRRHIRYKTTKQDILDELKVFEKAIGAVPLDKLCRTDQYDEEHGTFVDGAFDDLVDLCQCFVSDAAEKMREIQKEAKIKLKNSWL